MMAAAVRAGGLSLENPKSFANPGTVTDTDRSVQLFAFLIITQ